MKQIMGSISTGSVVSFKYFPKATLTTLGSLVGSLTGYYMYNRCRNVHIILRREYDRWSLLYMR